MKKKIQNLTNQTSTNIKIKIIFLKKIISILN